MPEKNDIKIVQVSIADLKPSEYNPRQASEAEYNNLKSSIEASGLVDPIIVNSAPSRKNIIIGGHFRLRIAKDLGIKEVPVVYVNIPDERKEQELNLRLNKNLGEWDFDLLANFDEDLLKTVGFTSEELDNVFDIKVKDDFDEEKEIKDATGGVRRTALGDIWQLGQHRIIIGDSTKRDNWKDLLQNERFDFMFTDPPYRIEYCKYGKVKKKEGFGRKANRKYRGVEAKGGVPEFDEWLSIANQHQNPIGASVMIFENWKNVVGLWQAIEKYWKIKNMVIWHLPNRCQGFAPTRRFFSKYDIAMLGGNGTTELNEEHERELDEYIRLKGQKLVFGTKPVAILVPYVKILSPRNGIVMEPFGGSGSTLIACELMKRQCRLIEFSDIYVEVIIRRWEKITGQKAARVRAGSGKTKATTAKREATTEAKVPV